MREDKRLVWGRQTRKRGKEEEGGWEEEVGREFSSATLKGDSKHKALITTGPLITY